MKKQKVWRHGDVIVVAVAGLPSDAMPIKGLVLAEGEATGHAHRVDLGELFKTKDGKLYLRIEKLAKLTHEEHKTITLDTGVYCVSQKRQYSPEGWETVRD